VRLGLTTSALACALLALSLAPRPAQANGRYPAASQLVADPGDPNTLVLRSTFGILYTHDHGTNWDWICEKAVGYGGVEDPTLGMTASGATLAAMFEGLAVSPGSPAQAGVPTTGCSWGLAGGGLAMQVVIDLVVRPDARDTALAITSTYSGATDAGDSLFVSQVFESTDDGANWAASGVPLDPNILTETLEVAASDPHRLYVSGITGSGSTLAAFLIVSTDDGAHWTERPVPIDVTTERGVFIAAVDPVLADRVYLRTEGSNAGRLLVTDDAGVTFKVVYTGHPMLGFVLSADGSTVFLGSMTDGLQVASTSDFNFTQRSSIQVQCLAFDGPTLFACSNEASGFVVGSSDDNGSTFTPKLHLSTVRGPLACPPGTTAASCVPDWPTVAQTIGAGTLDGGSQDGGGGDGGGGGAAVATPGGGCHCGFVGGAAARWGGVLGLILGAMLLFRHRGRSRRRKGAFRSFRP
jgi:hypothetical protein